MSAEAPAPTSPRAPLADAHADSLMWNRDLVVAGEEGHVDFPRLREAGVRLQCFTVVTRGIPVVDGFRLFARRQRWPRHALKGEWSACTWQLDRLAEFCLRSQGVASIAGSAQELMDNLAHDRLSAVAGVEGAHALEGDVGRVRELWARGVRFMGLTHLANNELGGSTTPLMGNKGLSPLGREVLDAMAQVGMALDVAHASPRTLQDMFEHGGPRPFCSHTGVQGVTPHWRNLPDDALRAIAERGGVVGVMFAPRFVGGKTLDAVARHLEHAVNVMGEDAVGLGSDFDGMIPLPQGMRDARDLPRLAEALQARGLPAARVDKLMGGNLVRFFGEVLRTARGLG